MEGFKKKDVGIIIFDMISITYKFKHVAYNTVPHPPLGLDTNHPEKHYYHNLWRFLYPPEYVHSAVDEAFMYSNIKIFD